MSTTTNPRPACELVGRQEIARNLAETLNMAGLRPYSVSVCGVYISARFRGPEPAHKAARIFAVAGFYNARVVESLDYAADQDSRKTLGPKTIRAWVATARATPRTATLTTRPRAGNGSGGVYGPARPTDQPGRLEHEQENQK